MSLSASSKARILTSLSSSEHGCDFAANCCSREASLGCQRCSSYPRFHGILIILYHARKADTAVATTEYDQIRYEGTSGSIFDKVIHVTRSMCKNARDVPRYCTAVGFPSTSLESEPRQILVKTQRGSVGSVHRSGSKSALIVARISAAALQQLAHT